MNEAPSIRLAAMASICAEFRSDDVRLFRLLLLRARRPDDRLDRLFRGYVRREAEYSYMLRKP